MPGGRHYLFRIGALPICVATGSFLLAAASLSSPFDTVHNAAKHNYLLAVWLTFRDREQEYLASPEWRLNYLAARSWVDSYLGEYRSALGLPLAKSGTVANDPGLRHMLERYEATGAVEAIAAAARNRRVVMINEEHRDPSHRAFTTELLPVLREQGFHYFAAEAFGPDIQEARYPKAGRDFTDDPVFGDLIRRALELGYTLVPYEAPSTCSAVALKAFNTAGAIDDNCMDGRELGQARNLARFVEQHPGEKLLVHAGMAHIQKADLPFGHLMAWHFRDLTKVDPLTIDQIYFSEGGGEAPEYAPVAEKYPERTTPFVLRSGDGFFLPENAEGIDIAVVHPRTRYVNGRPTWLSTGGWRRPVPIAQLAAYHAAIPALQKAGTTLLQVFLVTDEPDAVPIDQFLIKDPLSPPAPMLPSGSYRLRIIDRKGKTLAAFHL